MSSRKCGFMLFAALATSAVAAEPEEEKRPTTGTEPSAIAAAPRRTFGFGSLLGFGLPLGFSSNGVGQYPAGNITPILGIQLAAATVDARVFLMDEHALEVSIPVFGLIYNAAVIRERQLGLDAFFNFNVGRGNVRFISGPGVGFYSCRHQIYGAPEATAWLEFKVNGVIGVEFLRASRHFGIGITLRHFVSFTPFTEIPAYATGQPTFEVKFRWLLSLTIFGYGVASSSP